MRHPDVPRRKPTTAVKENSLHTSQSAHLTNTQDGNGERQATATDVIRVLIVDDHALLREGLRQLLEMEDDIEVAGEVADGFTALEQIEQDNPDVVLVDVHLPVMDGIVLARQIGERFPQIAVIMLTIHRRGSQVIEAMRYGARGYLLKSASVRELTQAIRRVHAGETVITPALTHKIINELRRSPEAGGNESNGLNTLSEREVELVRYIAAGLSNKEIAARLSYSEKTVKNYLSVIFQKLQLRDRTQVAIFALRQGLLPDEDAEPTPRRAKAADR